MRGGGTRILALALILGWRSLHAQDTFSLGIEGPPRIDTRPGRVVETYLVLLSHSGPGRGAQAWSFGVTATGASIDGATTAGTAADVVENGGFRLRGFEKTETVNPSLNGNRSGAVSAIVLSLTDPVRLPSNSTHEVGRLEVGFDVLEGSSQAAIGLVGDLRGSGLPVKIAVTQDGTTRETSIRGQQVAVRGLSECCDARLNVGFSAEPIRGAGVFDGIVGTGPLCSAGEGSIFHAAGAVPRKVYLNIVSDMEPGVGVQGWSFGVLLEGGGDVVSATTSGTAADRKENGGYWSGGFNKTELAMRGTAPGGRGAVTGIVLSLTEGTTLPVRGTESVLALEITGPVTGASVLSLEEGMTGSGQPVPNVITVNGSSLRACNQNTASVAIQHGHSDPLRVFRRGNANDDLRLDIADAIWLVNELYLDGPATPCPDDADANDDGLLDASDIVYLIEYLFRAGGSPPDPFTECGADPTPDGLDSCFGPSIECG